MTFGVRIETKVFKNYTKRIWFFDFLFFIKADKLLSVDFLPAVENLIEATPAERQLLLFSATFPSAIAEFKEKWLSECSVVNLMDNLTLKGLTQYYAYVAEAQKVHGLYALFIKVNKYFMSNLFIKSF